MNARYAALRVLEGVLVKRRSLTTARLLLNEIPLPARQRALAMELVNGVLRWRFRYDALLARLLSKPLRKKDYDLQLVLLIALHELNELSTPDYAIVHEAASQAQRLGKKWATGLINGVLRSYLRDREQLASSIDEDPVARFAHPQWLIDRLQQDWPEQFDQVLRANNQRPPLWLRVNLSKISVDDYLQQLGSHQMTAVRHSHALAALRLDTPMDVGQIPGFVDGLVSVQDAAAQMAAQLLAPKNDERVLDLCAAPGGKTCHLLELAGTIELMAVELNPIRMQQVQQNIERLNLQAQLIVADATDTQSWWDGRSFDRILVDAPCSASGVIRRHPDIKSLRQAGDLVELTEIQQQILQQAWCMLKPGGTLVYATCSVLKMENEQQIESLLRSNVDVEEVMIDPNWGVACRYGRQLLPGTEDSDGFYYALLKKMERRH
ncbi:MAG: 16S rRNA (cytosine(967)-C(5))-methyltransferase RsmB [Gammaproteobacteria bacterium]|nr:16S rRNA (cytosine(967)-C(5))-methyltransferase RsmB [Gammaproteobacteria bacterium]